ncbi:hypothetical protein LNV23_18990 [Paucibacter sp. DJ1R-11]|uniref:phage head-tail joining protein n=1 Tax=Paucibacter sp. DJ1R-11 TaxID=2893556 RepID=UPI0021E4CBE1|nr:hypothetical protein [Paucibacter sp. DJ1R-11]MCV2365540.1 hypothetical protein [Paucibacter sp. DJ1R-11]
MALTQTDLARLDSAIATSELEVEVDGQRVRYRSTQDLLAARAHVASVLSSSTAGGGAARRTGYPTFITSRER